MKIPLLLFVLLFTLSGLSQNENDQTWQQVKGKLRSISAGNKENVWGIGLNSGVWKLENNEFVPKKGVLSSISVGGDGTVYGIGVHNGVHKWENDRWVKIPGALRQISVGDADNIWGVDDGNNVWHRVADQWKKVPQAKASWISVGTDGTVWVVRVDATVWKWTGMQFEKQFGELKKIVVQDVENIWGLNFYNQPVKWNGRNWDVKYTGSAEDLSVGKDGSVWAIKANGNIYKIP